MADNEAMIDTCVQSSQQSSATASEARFVLNDQFRSNQFRLNLPMPVYEGDGTAVKKQKVVQDRAHSIDATIIKRMKTHKKMDFNELLTEVLQALSMFQPQPKFIKQRIEKLITDEFLARDAEDKSIIVYLP